jgi:hypothetical protein
MKRDRWFWQILISLLIILWFCSFFIDINTYATIEITDTSSIDVSVTFDSADDYRYNIPFENNSYFTVISDTSDWVLSVRSAATIYAGTIRVDEVLKCKTIPGDYNSTGWKFIDGEADTIIATGSPTTSTGSQVNVAYELNWTDHGLQNQGWDDFTVGQHSTNLIYTLSTN